MDLLIHYPNTNIAALGWIVSDSAVFGNSLLVRKFYSRN